MNNDGYGDVIVGAQRLDNGQIDEGKVFVYIGSACGLQMSPMWTAESDQTGANFGASVANAGDVNNDGYDDVVIGAINYDNFETDEGRAFLYPGSATGPAVAPVWTAEGNQSSAQFGWVAGAGDVNNDGYDDIIVGAPMIDNGQIDEGQAFVYLGTAAGVSATPAWTAECNQASAHFGASVASAGDVNNDGYDDVIVGARDFTNGESTEGRAYVYLGSASGLSPTPAWTAESNQASAGFGSVVASAGDVNGDGYDDAIVTALHYKVPVGAFFPDVGRVFLYLGSAGGLSSTPAWTADGCCFGSRFGGSIANAGDVDGDGLSDVVVGSAYGYNAILYLGSAAGLSGTNAWNVGYPWYNPNPPAGAVADRFNYAVAGAGDVDGDGHDDIVVGHPYFGDAFVYVHASATGSVGGVVLADGSPLANVGFTLWDPAIGQWVSTGPGGLYAANALRPGPLTVSIIVPLGYRTVTPEGGTATVAVCRGQVTTLDFELESLADAGAARGVGYWKHQVNVHFLGRGHAQESYDDMSATYPGLIYDHFYNNTLNPIMVDGATNGYGAPLDLSYMWYTLDGTGRIGPASQWARAAQQFLAVLLNVVSNRLHTGEVASDDGATASQAIQQVAALLLDDDGANDEFAKDIAEAMNEGRMLHVGVVDQSRPTIYYTQAMHSAPMVDQVRVAPNPMVRSSTIDFELATAGRSAVRVYDVAGRVVRTLLDGDLSRGRHTAVWDGASDSGKQVANGVYFYRIETPGGPLTARFVVMR